MSYSDMYPFPSSPLPFSPSSTIASRRCVRSSVLPLLSLNVGVPRRSTGLESPKAEPTTWTSTSFQNHLACGSFVPNTSAAATLRTFLPATITHARGRARYNSSQLEKEPKIPSSPSSPIPVITRTLPLSSDSRSPSPNRLSPTFSKVRRNLRNRTASEIHPSDLHPIFANLEQRSKFYVKKAVCASCTRAGSGFPQCGRCGDSWCSRECRLRGGKKHICRTRPTT